MAVLGTAGHVDHGKSTLVEQLTGIDPDRFEEEKRRGLTIDLGFAWLTLPSGREVGIVDVPGHERFIRNMLAGAGGISACLFVIAANEGWMPQTAEHLAIVDTLGIEHGVVALTKADLVSDDEIDAVRREVQGRLGGTSLAGARLVPCSARTGEGLDELRSAVDAALEAAGSPGAEGVPRLWIDRVFTIKGSGTVVTGTLTGGSLREGTEVVLAPEGVRARVRTIQTHKRRVVEVAPANRVALNLAGLERAQAERGDAIVQAPGWKTTRQVDALVRVLPSWATGGRDHVLTARGSHLMYVGSAEVPVRVRLLGVGKVTAGQQAFARLTLRDPLPLQRKDRFVLRDAGRVLTFGGGEILDPLPGRVDVELLRVLQASDASDAMTALVNANGRIDRDHALFRTGARSVPDGIAQLGEMLVSDELFSSLQGALGSALDTHHSAHPLEVGMALEAARATLDLDARSFDELVAQTPGIIEEGRFVRRASHRVRLSPEHERQREELLTQLSGSGFAPPLTADLPASAEVLRALSDTGEVVRVGDFYLAQERAVEAQARVRDFIEQEGSATVAQIRDLLGTTRKYAVPLCEWLDASGITIRRGDVRVLGPRASSLPR
jgi:selenocysteine-specific elongation factor